MTQRKRRTIEATSGIDIVRLNRPQRLFTGEGFPTSNV